LFCIGSVAICDLDYFLVHFNIVENYHTLHNLGGILLLSTILTPIYMVIEKKIPKLGTFPQKKVFAILVAAGILHLVLDILTYKASDVSGLEIGYQPFLPFSSIVVDYYFLMTDYVIFFGWQVPLSSLILLFLAIGTLYFRKQIVKRAV